MAINYRMMREKSGMSGADFARLTGTKVDRIYRIEAGKVKPTASEHRSYNELQPARTPTTTIAVLGDELQRLRFLAALTRADLAKHLGVSDVSVYRWETGRAIPNANQVRLYKQIGGDVDMLLSFRKLERKKDRKEILMLVKTGTNTAPAIAEAMGVQYQAVNSTLGALVSVGWLSRVRSGPTWIYSEVSSDQ